MGSKEASKKYQERQREIYAKLECIKVSLENHQEVAATVHYGHVGDMAYVSGQLDEILTFLRV